MSSHHGRQCVICNPVGSRNRRFASWDEGLYIYNRAKFKRCDDLLDEELETNNLDDNTDVEEG